MLRGHLGWVRAVAISPDGRSIVTGASDRALRGHSGSVLAVAISPDGRLIVTGSDDETVRVWDAATGAERRILPIGAAPRHLSISPCGTHIVTDRGLVPLPLANCQSRHHVFATRHWITADGDALLYLHPDYEDSFAFLSGSRAIYTRKGFHVLQLDLKRESGRS